MLEKDKNNQKKQRPLNLNLKGMNLRLNILELEMDECINESWQPYIGKKIIKERTCYIFNGKINSIGNTANNNAMDEFYDQLN